MYRLYIVEDDRGIAEAIRVQAKMWDLEVFCAKDFRNVMGEFAELNLTWCCLIFPFPFSMDITGVRKSERYPRFRLFLFLRHRII